MAVTPNENSAFCTRSRPQRVSDVLVAVTVHMACFGMSWWLSLRTTRLLPWVYTAAGSGCSGGCHRIALNFHSRNREPQRVGEVLVAVTTIVVECSVVCSGYHVLDSAGWGCSGGCQRFIGTIGEEKPLPQRVRDVLVVVPSTSLNY